LETKEQIKLWIEYSCPFINKKDEFVSSLKKSDNLLLTPSGYVVGTIKKGTFIPNPRAHMQFMFDPLIHKFT